MARFRFSEEAERTLGTVAPGCIPALEASVEGFRRYRELYGQSSRQERADQRAVQDDLRQLATRLQTLIETIDVMSRRRITREVLDRERLPSLNQLMSGNAPVKWSDLKDLRNDAARILTGLPRPASSSRSRRHRGRPRTWEGRLELAYDVATILRASRVRLTKTRNGPLAQALGVALAAVKEVVPKDPMRLLVKVCAEIADLPVEACRQYVRERYSVR